MAQRKHSHSKRENTAQQEIIKLKQAPNPLGRLHSSNSATVAGVNALVGGLHFMYELPESHALLRIGHKKMISGDSKIVV